MYALPYTEQASDTPLSCGGGGGVGGWGGVTHRLTDTEVGHSVHMNMTKGLLMGVTHLQLGDWGCLCSASAAA